ncbi:hypothetical protein MYX78_07640 [Acidobacteria bacterium AH-259-G07]|nr:hypothetical protein [Acidobacteria bacterium AH-259-G07]
MNEFETNLLRLIASELYLLASLRTSEEMFSKSYFTRGLGEKNTVDQTVLQMVGGNYQNLTPEALKDVGKSVGFQAASGAESASKQPFGRQEDKK